MKLRQLLQLIEIENLKILSCEKKQIFVILSQI